MTYAKIVLIVALIGVGWWLRGLVESKHQLVLAQAAAAALEVQSKKIRAVEDSYDALKDIPDPVVTGVTTRLRLIAAAIPEAPAVAGGTQSACPQPASLGRLKSAVDGVTGSLGRYVQACSDDARQLDAVIRLAP